MKTSTKNIIIALLIIVVILLLGRYVIFRQQFENMSAGLDRIGAWQDGYRKDHPGASKDEVDAAFKASIGNLEVWQARYKQEHPDATKAEMDAAFNSQFSRK